MRVVFLALAAVFSLVAIGARLWGQPTWMSVAALVVAGGFLVAGLWLQARQQIPHGVVLDEEQRATIRRMKGEGNHSGAISQVQLWFKYATADQAREAVAEA